MTDAIGIASPDPQPSPSSLQSIYVHTLTYMNVYAYVYGIYYGHLWEPVTHIAATKGRSANRATRLCVASKGVNASVLPPCTRTWSWSTCNWILNIIISLFCLANCSAQYLIERQLNMRLSAELHSMFVICKLYINIHILYIYIYIHYSFIYNFT